MRKYLEIAKLTGKAQLSWRFDILASAFIALVRVLFAMIVWGAVFGERQEVAGFTLQTMVSYYVIGAFLSQLDMSQGIAEEVSRRIRDGTFTKYMVIPVKAERYFLFQTLGAATVYILFTLGALAGWVLLFGIDFVVSSDPVMILSAAALALLGLVFMTQLNYFLGILAFKFQDVSNFLMIKDNILELVKGNLVPLALLPAALLSAMRFLPFYHIAYLPAMLLIGRNREEIGLGMVTLLLWMAVFFLINNLAYGRLRRKYDGVGI